MWLMGISFKSPKQSNVMQWQKVEALRRAGFTFHINYGRTPKSLRDVVPFLKWWKQKSDGERLLET
jgi:hypothetical protein